MLPLCHLGGDAAALIHFLVMPKIIGSIQTSRRHNHMCVFWKPTMLII
jgi:hypothetical protein